jgi:pimeloyl-ACP methyl ester carboxylesterase
MCSRDGYFVSGGVRLRFRDEGGGLPVVFVHGWTLDLEVWNLQARALAAALRVIRLDRRGFGLSQGAPSPEADPLDLRALLDCLAIPRAAIVGASQGARAALAFALENPERVTALVLDGPPDAFRDDGNGDDADLALDELRDIARTSGMAGFRRAWAGHPYMRLRTADAEARALLAAALSRYPGKDLACAAGPRTPLRGAADLARLVAPVLVVNGECDTPLRCRAGERLCQALPNANRVVIAGAGHLPNLDDPRAYNDVLRDFLLRRARVAA